MRPSVATLPTVGCEVPVISFSRVLLPAPLMPIKPTDSPGLMSMSMSCSTHFNSWRRRLDGDSHSASLAH